MNQRAIPLLSLLLAGSVEAQTFTDVAGPAGVGFADLNTSASAWRDFDGDGDEDLFLSINGGSFEPNDVLARNEGDGTFVDVAAAAGVQGPLPLSFQLTAAWADYDNDGDADLFVGSSDPNLLYRNDGDGTFTDVTIPSGLAALTGGAKSAAWADVDSDGWLDLYIARWNQANYLLHNNGDGTFTDVAGTAGVDHGTAATGAAAFCDIDGDGDPDLLSCSVSSSDPTRLFRNDGNLVFTDISPTSGLAPIRSGAGLWGDFDNDGDCDLYLATVYSGTAAGYHYYNDGSGHFLDAGTSTGLRFSIPEGVVMRGMSAADFDNDSDLDIYLTCNNNSNPVNPPRNYLFLNNGTGVFVNVAASEGVADTRLSEGSSWADYDGDGDLDLFAANDWPQACRLYRNDTTGAHWAKLVLVGVASNRDAVGARVRLRAGGLWQTRQIDGGGTGVNCQDSLPVEFGLGGAVAIEMVVIGWPSGLQETYLGLALDTEHVLVEGTSGGCPAPTNYCVGAPNSAGPGAQLSTTGTTSISANDLVLHATGAPPMRFALFFYGPAATQVPFFDGFLCVGGGSTGLLRMPPPAMTDGAGAFSRVIDYGAHPMNAGAGKVSPGDRWYFQLWYRDPTGPLGTGSNTSDALDALFCF